MVTGSDMFVIVVIGALFFTSLAVLGKLLWGDYVHD